VAQPQRCGWQGGKLEDTGFKRNFKTPVKRGGGSSLTPEASRGASEGFKHSTGRMGARKSSKKTVGGRKGEVLGQSVARLSEKRRIFSFET